MMKNSFTKLKRNYLTPLLFTLLAFSLTGCFKDDGVDQKYFKIFENIKTDQFRASYGNRGIYWISNDTVVLNAQVTTESGSKKRGIFQVNMDGMYQQLVDTDEIANYKYCFDGSTLHIRNDIGGIELIKEPEGYNTLIGSIEYISDGTLFSPLRCVFVNRPEGDGGYVALKSNDGFVNNRRNIKSEKAFSSNLVNNKGDFRLTLDSNNKSFVSRPRYLEHSDEYFFQRFRRGCALFSWVKRNEWSVQTKEFCFDEWIESTSKIANATKVGLFVEQHTQRYPTAFLITENSRYPIESKLAVHASVSPDGCRVAYGYGDYRPRKGNSDYRQMLKVFNACKFMEDK